MKTFYGLNDFLRSPLSFRRYVATIGVFDGVHRAHRKVIKAVTAKARKKRFSSLVVTFDPHPANVLGASRRVPLLMSLKHRLRLLGELGVDCVIVLRFNRTLSRMSASDFIGNTFGKIRIEEIAVGRNFFFGREKKGSLKILKRLSGFYRYGVCVIGAVKSSGRAISSTWIRNLILRGELAKASHLLSHPVTVLGTVVKGHKRGRIIGFPTANIDPHHEAIPPSGVYAVRIKLGKRLYGGLLNIGVRPTFRGSRDREPTIEAHIFDFSNSIYGKDLAITFVKKIRREKKFKDARALRKKIEEDEKRARQILC